MNLKVRVIPNAKKSEFAGYREAELILRLSPPPVDAKANKAAIEFVSRYFGVPRSGVLLAGGERSRHKFFLIQGLNDLEIDETRQGFAVITNAGVGSPYWVAAHCDAGIGTMSWPSYDYGTTHLWVCGLLNYLIILDAFDNAQGRKP